MEYLEVSPDQFAETLPEDYLEENEDHASRRRRRVKAKRTKRRTARRKARPAKKTVRKTRRKTRRVKVKKAIKKTAKKLASVGTRAILAPLLPLRPIMIKALKSKGKAASRSTKIDVLARDFYNYVVVPHSKGNFEEIHFDPDVDHIAGTALTAIASAVVTFIKSLKKKKAEGEPMSSTEKTIVKGTEAVEAQIEEKAKEEAAREVGGKLLFDKKTQLIIAGVLVVAIGAFVMVKKKG